jgi:hypothetical protein
MADRSESRREFVGGVGRMAAAVTFGASLAPATLSALPVTNPNGAPAIDWDMSWVERVKAATDRAVFDWPTLGSPGDSIVLQIAARYLDGCAAVYADQKYDARAVLNIRTQAVSAALTDAMWDRFALGAETSTNDPYTKQPAVRNPFMYRAPELAPGVVSPSLADLLGRGSIALVCDFALGHLARRLATKVKREQPDVHAELRAGLVHGSYLMPSGIFGLAKAQNAGCAYVRM